MNKAAVWKVWLAAGLGSGWLPKAPGTWGSLAAILPGWLLFEFTGFNGLLIATVLLLIIGCWICVDVLKALPDKDPGWIVVDEWVGLWCCMLLLIPLLGAGLDAWLVAFVAFRFFDIVKPWPISYIETLGPVWWSIMADDVAAGLIGGGAVLLALSLLKMV